MRPLSLVVNSRCALPLSFNPLLIYNGRPRTWRIRWKQVPYDARSPRRSRHELRRQLWSQEPLRELLVLLGRFGKVSGACCGICVVVWSGLEPLGDSGSAEDALDLRDGGTAAQIRCFITGADVSPLSYRLSPLLASVPALTGCPLPPLEVSCSAPSLTPKSRS